MSIGASPPTARDVRKALDTLADPAHARTLARYFTTGPGEYGEGDRFLGITVPAQRALVRRFRGLPLDQALSLLISPWHEHRLTALHFMVDMYSRGDDALRHSIFDAYLAHTAHINNWDLVDSSTHFIVGPHVAEDPHPVLDRLARSSNPWERRIAVVATLHFIRLGDHAVALHICRALLHDTHDLIHKAVGWMLRETGKHASREALLGFLDAHATTMPRTALRYAIERLTEEQRRHYMALGAERPSTRTPRR